VGGGPVACGAGPELALVVPLLMWLRSRRRRVARLGALPICVSVKGVPEATA
jgi:hypothetical protein